MIMVDGTIDEPAWPNRPSFTVLLWCGIDFYIFGSSLGDTIIVCLFNSCSYRWLARICIAKHISYLTSTIHALYVFGYEAQ